MLQNVHLCRGVGRTLFGAQEVILQVGSALYAPLRDLYNLGAPLDSARSVVQIFWSARASGAQILGN